VTGAIALVLVTGTVRRRSGGAPEDG